MRSGVVFLPATPTGIRAGVVKCLLEAGRSCLVYPCLGDLDYWRGLRAAWEEAASDLLVVEHDVLVDPGLLSELGRCDHPWCCAPYPGGDETLLGATRFRPEKLGAFPVPAATPWLRLDQEVYWGLVARGYRPHPHRNRPPTHLHGVAT